MIGLSALRAGIVRARTVLTRVQTPLQIQKCGSHGHGIDEFPQPFDNMPFRINSRYAATTFWCVFFGLGLWAPYIIVWYSMAKRTL